MKKIHCIYCNKLNNVKDEKCIKCDNYLHEIDQYYLKLLKGEIEGKIKDSFFAFLTTLIKQHIYGIVLTLTVVAGVTTNVIARQDNAPVVNSVTESTTTEVRHTEVVNNDYIAAQFATEQFMNMVSSLDNKDYTTYDKLSYDYAYGTNIYDELVSSGHGLEDFIRKYSNKVIYFNSYDIYDTETYNPPHPEIIAEVEQTALKRLTSPNEFPTGEDIKIDNLEAVKVFYLQAMACEDTVCRASYLATQEYGVILIKVNSEWFYLYSSNDNVRCPKLVLNNIRGSYENVYEKTYRYRGGDFHEDITHYYEKESDY